MTMPTEPIKPEDIKPGDWVRYTRYGANRLAVVTHGNPGTGFYIDRKPWWLPLDSVLEIRRG